MKNSIYQEVFATLNTRLSNVLDFNYINFELMNESYWNSWCGEKERSNLIIWGMQLLVYIYLLDGTNLLKDLLKIFLHDYRKYRAAILFFFKHLYWSIIALHCCVTCCCITKWIRYTYTYIPISPPSYVNLPPSLSHPSRWSPSTELISLCYAAASH